MQGKKIIVIGCPGSGKSTFSRKLKELTKLPLYYLDMIWHKEDKTNISREEFDNQLNDILKKDEWIIDGNYQRTLEMRFEKCDTVFLFDLPTDVCISGVEERMGIKREDMPWTETKWDMEFKQWIIDFPNTVLPKIYKLVEKYKRDKDIVIFKLRQEADDFLKLKK